MSLQKIRYEDRGKMLGGSIHVMQERGMNINDLGKVLGSQPTASLILNRKRQLSKASIKKLAAYFQLSTSLFL